jgi:hypothetical protein
MEKTIKTVLHAYRFDISKTEEQAQYLSMVETIRAQFAGKTWTSDMTGGYTACPDSWKFAEKIQALGAACSIELETAHLFADQWNSAPMPGFDTGARLFNWSENVYLNKHIKAGYWLDQTADMREALRNTMTCGYCGKQEPAQKGYVFCPHCIDSEFLKKSDLNLTRMVAVRDTSKKRAELTQAERDHLYPLYDAAQKHGATERGIARLAKAKADIEKRFTDTVRKATMQRDAARWIVANIPRALDNWIYYDHTGVHCFGWRNPLTADEVSALLDVISEFPFQYELICADGRKLSN